MNLIGQGIVLMVAGMGIVYAFLYIMIIVCEKASKIVSKYDHLVPDEPKKKHARHPLLQQQLLRQQQSPRRATALR